MKRWTMGALVGAALGIVAVAIAWAIDPSRAAYGWLVAFYAAYTTATGALLLLLIGDATDSVWLAVIRRPVEAMIGTLPLLAIMFVPILLSLAYVYPWAPGGLPLTPHQEEILGKTSGWLNSPFFVVRSAIYLLVPTILGELALARGKRGGERAARRRFAAITLPIVILLATFAGFDWIMSLEPGYSSTAFGLIPTTGGFMAALGLVSLVLAAAHRRGALPEAGPEHSHAIGKLLLTAVCFWAYLAFFQYMLGWIANLPMEARWYLPRTRGAWGWIGFALILGHFALPFLALLSRGLKRTDGLAVVGGVLVFMHWLDLYWLAVPALRTGPTLHLADVGAALAVFGAALALASFRASRASPLPKADPLLERSLRYRSE